MARGIDVRVLKPSTSGSDNPIGAARGWCSIDSANLDDRSFETNPEITLGIRDAATDERLDPVFEKYAARAGERSAAE